MWISFWEAIYSACGRGLGERPYFLQNSSSTMLTAFLLQSDSYDTGPSPFFIYSYLWSSKQKKQLFHQHASEIKPECIPYLVWRHLTWHLSAVHCNSPACFRLPHKPRGKEAVDLRTASTLISEFLKGGQLLLSSQAQAEALQNIGQL